MLDSRPPDLTNHCPRLRGRCSNTLRRHCYLVASRRCSLLALRRKCALSPSWSSATRGDSTSNLVICRAAVAGLPRQKAFRAPPFSVSSARAVRLKSHPHQVSILLKLHSPAREHRYACHHSLLPLLVRYSGSADLASIVSPWISYTSCKVPVSPGRFFSGGLHPVSIFQRVSMKCLARRESTT